MRKRGKNLCYVRVQYKMEVSAFDKLLQKLRRLRIENKTAQDEL